MSHFQVVNPWGENNDSRFKSRANKIHSLESKINSFFDNGNYLKPRFALFGLSLLFCLWIASGFYTVQPDEQGIEIVFGKYYDSSEPGLRYNFPSPVGDVIKVKIAAVNREDVGLKDKTEKIRGQSMLKKEDGYMLTGDENILGVSFEVMWKVSDSYAFLFNVRENAGDITVANAAESAMRDVIGQSPMSFILKGEGRAYISTATHDLLQKTLDFYKMGIDILAIQVKSIEPPEAVINSFRDVQSAKADKEMEINQAEGYSNDILPKSRGEAESIIQEALSYKQEVISKAQGDASRFESIYYQYKAAPCVTRKRMYLEYLEKILKSSDKFILMGKSNDVLKHLPVSDLWKG